MEFVQIQNPANQWCKVNIKTGLIISTDYTPYMFIKRLKNKQWALDNHTGRIVFRIDLSPKKK